MGQDQSPDAPMLVLSTAPDPETARDLARQLVDRRLAACVNLLPSVTSVYRWKDAIEEETEVLMVLKSCRERLPELEAALLELHPYDTPEFVVLEPGHVEARYLAWLTAETASR